MKNKLDKSKSKILAAFSILLLVAIGLIGYFVVYPFVDDRRNNYEIVRGKVERLGHQSINSVTGSVSIMADGGYILIVEGREIHLCGVDTWPEKGLVCPKRQDLAVVGERVEIKLKDGTLKNCTRCYVKVIED